MTIYAWSVSELKQQDGFVVQAKYSCKATKSDLSVETEGYWNFRKKNKFSKEITEQLVGHWIDLDAQDGNRHMIKSRLDEQLEALENQQNNDPPWKVETFKVTL